MRSIATLFFLLFMVNACIAPDECTTRQNERLPVQRTNRLVLQSRDSSYIINMSFRKGKGFPNYSYIVANEDFYTENNVEGLFSIGEDFIINNLHPLMDVKPEGKGVWYVLYTYGVLKEMDTIKADNIEGVSVYAKKNNILYHKIYKRTGDKLINLTYFNARVDGIVSNHLTTFGKYFFAEQNRHLDMIRFVTFDHFSFSEEVDSLNAKMEVFHRNPNVVNR